MIVAATIHSSRRTNAIDDMASRNGRSTSVFTSPFDIVFRPAGTLDGAPANKNAVASGWPPTAIAWASARGMYTTGRPAYRR